MYWYKIWNINKKQPLPSHLAWAISSSDGSIFISGPFLYQDQLLLILSFIIFLLFWLSQMFLKIISFHILQTCLHLWRPSRLRRPIIIMISLKTSSGSVVQSTIIFCWNLKYFTYAENTATSCSLLELYCWNVYEDEKVVFKELGGWVVRPG